MSIEDFRQKKILWYGRYLDYFGKEKNSSEAENSGIRFFSYSASGFCFVLKGKRASVKIVSDSKKWNEANKAVLGIFINEGNSVGWKSLKNEPDKRIILTKPENEILLFESEKEKTVTIRVIKLSEAAFAYAGLKELNIEGKLLSPKNIDSEPLFGKIEFIGDSITCGYGIEGGLNETFTTAKERADKSYAFLTAKMLNAEIQNCCWSGIGIISNWVEPERNNIPKIEWLMPSLWPYTDKAVSLRLKLEPEVWNANKFIPDVVVINLGTNDSSYVQNHENRKLSFITNYRSLLEAVHLRSPNAKICCCLGVMGQDLYEAVEDAVNSFKKDFPSVKIKAVKFPVQNEAEDGISTDWHPSAKTHLKIAKQLVKELKKL